MPRFTGLIDLTDRISVQQCTPLLIAHRGGVIGPATPQCSILAIKRAAHHGYHFSILRMLIES